MTRHKHAQTGLVIPSLPQLLLTAALRMLAMLVLNVASTLQMICRRPSVNATRATPTDLPRAKTDTQQETIAVQQDSPTSAHPEQARYARRPSKDERVLTTLEADIHVRVPRVGGDPVHFRTTRAKRSEPLRGLSGPPPARGMQLLKQLATNKNAAA